MAGQSCFLALTGFSCALTLLLGATAFFPSLWIWLLMLIAVLACTFFFYESLYEMSLRLPARRSSGFVTRFTLVTLVMLGAGIAGAYGISWCITTQFPNARFRGPVQLTALSVLGVGVYVFAWSKVVRPFNAWVMAAFPEP
jgi:hypothetical protein